MPVVDASVVVDWVAPGADPASRSMATLRRLAVENAELMAPRLLVEEVANALITGIRGRRWSGAEADVAFAALRRLPIRLADDARDLARAWDLARRYDDHPLYDMLYIALAERANTTFITTDDRLRQRLLAFPWVVAPDRV